MSSQEYVISENQNCISLANDPQLSFAERPAFSVYYLHPHWLYSEAEIER